MSTIAIVMMIIAMVVVWGGLIAAVINLRARGDVPDSELAEPGDMTAEDEVREHDAPLRRDT